MLSPQIIERGYHGAEVSKRPEVSQPPLTRDGRSLSFCRFFGHVDNIVTKVNRRVEKMARRTFSREFKLEAVNLITDRGVAVAQASRDLDVGESVLRRWVREQVAAPATAFPGHGQLRVDAAEVAALRKQVARLKAERDILKRAVSFFAREAI